MCETVLAWAARGRREAHVIQAMQEPYLYETIVWTV